MILPRSTARAAANTPGELTSTPLEDFMRQRVGQLMAERDEVLSDEVYRAALELCEAAYLLGFMDSNTKLGELL